MDRVCMVCCTWTGGPFYNKKLSLTSSINLLDGWCPDTLKFPKRMALCDTQTSSRFSEKAPPNSLPRLVACNASHHNVTHSDLSYDPDPQALIQTWAPHIWASPSPGGQLPSSSSLPVSPEGLISIRRSTPATWTVPPRHRYPSDAASLWPHAELLSLLLNSQAVCGCAHTLDVGVLLPCFNMAELCLVPPILHFCFLPLPHHFLT